MLIITQESRLAIAAHGEATYPDECVGLLLGRLEGERKLVTAIYRAENRWSGQVALAASDDPTSRRDRFYLDPRDYMRADRAAQAKGLEVVGIYHSHPDHPATPSERDRVGAQAIGGASFAFVIQSVRDGRAAELASWLLVDDGARFVPEEIGSMAVTISIPTAFRQYAGGNATVSVEAAQVGAALRGLVEQHQALGRQIFGDDGRLRSFVNVYVGDEDIRYLQGEETPLRDGDLISIIPAIAGGGL